VQLGRPLDPPEEMATVRVRDGETLVTDGPFVESKEFVGGFDVTACDDLDTAVQIASDHPVAATGAIEIRPFMPGLELSPAAREWGATDPGDSWCLLLYADGIPASDEVEAGIRADGHGWAQALTERGVYMFGHPLEHADAATTVRVDGTEMLLTDGPFVEAKEFIAGVVVLAGVTREQAIEAGADHPLARFHRVEVRKFMDF
jgi:hypothetical protein